MQAGRYAQGCQPGNAHFRTSCTCRQKVPETGAVHPLVPSPLREERKAIAERYGPAINVPGYRWVCGGGTIGIHDLQLDDTKRGLEGVFIQCACRVPVVQNLLSCVCLGSIPLGIRTVGRNTHVNDLRAGGAPGPIPNVVNEARGQV